MQFKRPFKSDVRVNGYIHLNDKKLCFSAMTYNDVTVNNCMTDVADLIMILDDKKISLEESGMLFTFISAIISDIARNMINPVVTFIDVEDFTKIMESRYSNELNDIIKILEKL